MEKWRWNISTVSTTVPTRQQVSKNIDAAARFKDATSQKKAFVLFTYLLCDVSLWENAAHVRLWAETTGELSDYRPRGTEWYYKTGEAG